MAEYLVRGALLACECGTHPRKLNLPQSHGIYINEKAQILETDCKIDENIRYFGICLCNTPPSNAETVTLLKYGDAGEDGTVVTGYRCCPDIIGSWRDCMERNVINNKEKTVTTDSYLVCRYGGLIQPISSGQKDDE